MKNKDEIKLEIFELAQKISRASSEKFLMETTKELFEKSILLKYAKEIDTPVVTKQEEKIVVVTEVPIAPKAEVQPPAQATIDLFSGEITSPIPSPTEEAVKVSPEGGDLEGAKKPAVKERKEPKKTADETMAEKLQHKRIADLKAAIGINEKFQFINELFDGNMKEYNCAVDQVNNFSSHSEAESYIANLKDVYKWQPDNHIADSFMELVQRRFA